MIGSILIATDGSAAANRAVDLAAELSVAQNCALHLISVVRNIQVPPDMQDMARVEHLGETRLSVLEFVANQVLDSAVARAEAKGASVALRIVGYGDPATAIANHARKHGIELLVLGTRGLSQVKSVLMGSVSRKVTEISEVNCLLVR